MTELLDPPISLRDLARISVADFHRADELGIHGRHALLIRGLVMEKPSISPFHLNVSKRLQPDLLRRRIIGTNHLHRLDQLIEIGPFPHQFRTKMEVSHSGWALEVDSGTLARQAAVEQPPDHWATHLAEMLPQLVVIPVPWPAELLDIVEDDHVVEMRFHVAPSPQSLVPSSAA